MKENWKLDILASFHLYFREYSAVEEVQLYKEDVSTPVLYFKIVQSNNLDGNPFNKTLPFWSLSFSFSIEIFLCCQYEILSPFNTWAHSQSLN